MTRSRDVANIDGILTAKGDIYAATAAATPARLGVGSDGQVLKANSATATGLEWAADAAGMTNPMTTTGDTIYSSSGSTPARLGIGSTGQVLTVSGGVPSWATASSGGMTLLSTTTLSGASTTISSINQTYVDLVAYVVADRPTAAAGFYVSHNGNSANYSNWGNQQGSNFGGTAESYLLNAFSATSTTNDSNFTQIVFPYYSATNNRKMAIMNRSFLVNASTRQNISAMGFYYNDTAALTSITFHYPGTTFAGGTVYLYGVK